MVFGFKIYDNFIFTALIRMCLKIEFASLKKGHTTPPHQFVPTTRKILPAAPSKYSLQKTLHHSDNYQIDPKDSKLNKS